MSHSLLHVVADEQSDASEDATATATAAADELRPAARGLCMLCETQFSQYTCPRCGIPYCSLACYRGERHADCSEGFYKEHFMEELKHRSVSAEERAKMMKMLQDFEAADADGASGIGSDDGDDDIEDGDVEFGNSSAPSLASRLAGLDLDALDEGDDDDQDGANALWARLTPQEQAEFLRQIREGHISDLLEPWVPWWTTEQPASSRIQPVSGMDDDKPNTAAAAMGASSARPQVDASEIPPLSTLLGSKTPSPLLLNNLVDLLMTYAFCCRAFHGDVQSDALEVLSLAATASPVLAGARNHETPLEAVHGLLRQIRETAALAAFAQHTKPLVADAVRLLSSPESVLAAMADMHGLAAHGTSQNDLKRLDKHARRMHKSVERKLFFYLVWWHAVALPSSSPEPALKDVVVSLKTLEHLRAVLDSEDGAIREAVQAAEAAPPEQPSRNKPRVFIEEISPHA
eukprot:m.309749 g.309749  ORF g.309749 m.309749 type:complete len:461 (-) comp23632_c0_seq1:132-1514(-)